MLPLLGVSYAAKPTWIAPIKSIGPLLSSLSKTRPDHYRLGGDDKARSKSLAAKSPHRLPSGQRQRHAGVLRTEATKTSVS